MVDVSLIIKKIVLDFSVRMEVVHRNVVTKWIYQRQRRKKSKNSYTCMRN
jgi:hypothetical protein